MPRTHRTLFGSRSVSYKVNKNRKFAKRNDRNSHHSNRIDNMYASEVNFTKFNCKTKRTAKGINSKDCSYWVGLYGQPSSVPNQYCTKFLFVNNGQTLKEQLIKYSQMGSEQKIEHFKNIRDGEFYHGFNFSDNFIDSSIKQLQRRGELKPFVSHRKGNVSRKDY